MLGRDRGGVAADGAIELLSAGLDKIVEGEVLETWAIGEGSGMSGAQGAIGSGDGS